MLQDITNIPSNLKTYGGLDCKKVGVTLDGVDYLVKYPTSVNNTLSEYIGSEIFKLFKIPVHNVSLVMRNGVLCSLCEDFVKFGRLIEFRELKSTYEPGFMNPDGNESDGSSTDLDEALLVIRNHPIISKLHNYESFFWKMFIIDALIGNRDRNSDNYGIVINGRSICIAPVYDNGNCLNPSWSESKMQVYLDDMSKMIDVAYKVNTCRFTLNGKPINPFKVIESGKYKNCTEALKMINSVSITDIVDIIECCPVINSLQKKFLSTLLRLRFQCLKDSLLDLTDNNFSEEYINKVKDMLNNYSTNLTLSEVLVRLPAVELDTEMLNEVIRYIVS